MPPIPLEVRTKGKPWPGYFLVRSTGEVVPLIAVDELPPKIELVGVPRSLDLAETIGMLNLGLQRSTGGFYQFTQGEEIKTRGSEEVGKAKSSDVPDQPASPSKSTRDSTSTASSPAPKATTAANLPTSPAATQLCRHWCAYGICKWGQQCRYRHIMPMTARGLEEVGLPDWPSWFRKQNPGYFVSDSRGAGAPASNGRAKRILAGRPGICCGSLHGVNGVCGGRSERLRGNGRVTVREKATGRLLKNEELGEQIVARLRNISKEGTVISEKAVGAQGGNATIERAAARDTKAWEDESEGEVEDNEIEGNEKVKQVVHGKLVDV